MGYFIQDIIFFSIGLFFIEFMIVFMAWRRRFPRGGILLLALTVLLSISSLTDLIFRINPDPQVVMLADSVNFASFLFVLAILFHFSISYYRRRPMIAVWLIYLPPPALLALYVFTPLLVSGLIHNPLGFKIIYSPYFWWVAAGGAAVGLLAVAFNLLILLSQRSWEEKDRSIFLLLVIFSVLLFYGSNFLFGTGNAAYSLPPTLAIMLIVYGFARRNFFTLESLS